jgi:hypothetical protein
MPNHLREEDTGTCDDCGRDVTCEADTEARIVAWLRTLSWAHPPCVEVGVTLADAIERGDHKERRLQAGDLPFEVHECDLL